MARLSGNDLCINYGYSNPSSVGSGTDATARYSLNTTGLGRLPSSDKVSVPGDTYHIAANSHNNIPVCCRMETDKRLGVGNFKNRID